MRLGTSENLKVPPIPKPPGAPTAKIKKPPLWTTYFKDPYQTEYFSRLSERADEVYYMHTSWKESGIVLTVGEKKLLDRSYDAVKSLRPGYAQACSEGNKNKAHGYVVRLKLRVTEIEKVSHASYHRAKHFLDNEEQQVEVYKRIESRVEEQALFECGSHIVWRCDYHLSSAVERVIDWFNSFSTLPRHERRVLRLKGGKRSNASSLVHLIASTCSAEGALGASFVFTKKTAPRKFLLSHFIPTIVDSIATNRDEFKVTLLCTLNDLQDSKVHSYNIRKQTEMLLLPAYNNMPEKAKETPFVIAFDGLDRCLPDVVNTIVEFINQCLRFIPSVYFVVPSPDPGADKRCWIDESFTNIGLDSRIEDVPLDDVPDTSPPV